MKKALDNPGLGIKVIDVREADEYEIAKVDGVPLLPLSQISERLHGTRSEPAILSALQSRRAFVEGAELPVATGIQISQECQRRHHRLERGD